MSEPEVTISPAMRNALMLLQQYRRLNKVLTATQLHGLRVAMYETINCGGTVALVFTDTGPQFQLTTKPTRALPAKKVPNG